VVLLFAAAVRYVPGLRGSSAGWGSDGARRFATSGSAVAGVTIVLAAVVFTVGFSLARGTAASLPTPKPFEASTAKAGPSVPAADLRLPADYTFTKGEESPGSVTFSHGSHVDGSRPDCGICHQKLFRISEPGRPVDGELSKTRVHEGDLCASCHNGQQAFSVQDDCAACHRD
jgi:c(7)-type cytochrome triheme protein